GLVAEAGDPGGEAGLEGLGLEQHEDAAEDILAGDAGRQVKEPQRSSSLNLAHRAMAVGPAAPARTARTAMTRTLGRGCRRLIWERGSSRVEKDATISSSLLRALAISDLRPPGLVHDTVGGIPGQRRRRKTAKFTGSL